MASGIIDVWNIKTFDDELAATLVKNAELMRHYVETDIEIDRSYKASSSPARSTRKPPNPYYASFRQFKKSAGELMRSRTIRAWHYTRLTEFELNAMLRDGIYLSTPKTLRTRLNTLVASGYLSVQSADTLFENSPLHGEQLECRTNKFWMVSDPIEADSSMVKPLMDHWGGEVVSSSVVDSTLLTTLAAIGKPRVFEIEVPMTFTDRSYCAGETVVETYGRSLGFTIDNSGFDRDVTKPLPPTAILRVHGIEDSTFQCLGREYPVGYRVLAPIQ